MKHGNAATDARSGPGHFALRKGRHSEVGRIYLVTFATAGRQKTFLDVAKADVCVTASIDERLWRSSRLLAWVLMPDHWHGLIRLGEGDLLSQRVGLLKANTSRRVAEKFPSASRVWARGFHDHSLRNEQRELLETARYIVLNPVRSGLVRRASDYPYWGAIWVQR